MATGPAGGTYERYGEQYRRYLEKYGVTLELRPSSGSVQNFAWLRDAKVDVAFVQGGEGEPAPAEAQGEPPVVSLGALYYEPMWVFQTAGGAPVDKLTDLKGKRLAVGVDGSGTQSLALHLLRESGIDAGNTTLLRIGGAAMLKALDAREVDAVFQVAGVEAPLLADLLRRRDLTLMSLVHAPAYAKRHGKLTALTVPRGVVDIEADLPPRDVSIVAVTANLLARNEVHPALMYLLARHRRHRQQRPRPARRGRNLSERARAGRAGRRGGRALLQVGQAFPAALSAVLGGEFRGPHADPADPDIRRAHSGDQARSRPLHLPAEGTDRPRVRATRRGRERIVRGRRTRPASANTWRGSMPSRRRSTRHACRNGSASRPICCAPRSTSCASGCARPTPRPSRGSATGGAKARALERLPTRRKVLFPAVPPQLYGHEWGATRCLTYVLPPWPACSIPQRLRRWRRTCARTSPARDAVCAPAAVPKALIAPHAGYVYSGPIAAAAYARLAAGRETIRRVVLFGPTHRVPVRGLALPSARAFATPLGNRGRRSRRRRRGADAAAGVRKRRRARVRALARSAAAVPAGGARRFQHRAVRRRRRDARRGGRSHRVAVGRPGDADRRQLRPVALPPLRRRARNRSRDRRGDPRAVGHARSRAGLRRDADQRIAPGGPPARTAAGAARPAQLRRHGGRQVPRGRLCVVRVHRARARRAPGREPRHDRR